MPKPRVFISYCTRDAKAVALKDDLARRLRDEGYRVLVDSDELKLGDDWRSTLNVWTQKCDAAVVLLGKEALESAYVAYEVSIFHTRKAADDEFGLFPVFLDVDYKAVANSRLSPWKIQDVESVLKSTPPGQVPAKIIEALTDLEERTTPLDRCSRRLAGLLQGVEEYQLEDEAADLGVDLGPWVPPDQLRLRLALTMLAAGLTRSTPAIRNLRGDLGEPQRRNVQNIVDLVGSSWVDLSSAHAIPAVSAKERAAIGINGADPTSARLYVIRSCDRKAPHDAWRVAEVAGCFGEDAIDDIVTETRAALCGAFGCDDDEVEDEVQTKTENDEPVFVALPAKGLDKSTVDALRSRLDEEGLGGVTFFFLVGAEPDDATLKEAGVDLLVPLLGPGDEERFCDQYRGKSTYLLQGI